MVMMVSSSPSSSPSPPPSSPKKSKIFFSQEMKSTCRDQARKSKNFFCIFAFSYFCIFVIFNKKNWKLCKSRNPIALVQTNDRIHIRSISCVFLTGEPCKDRLILTAIPCRKNPNSEHFFNRYFLLVLRFFCFCSTVQTFSKIFKSGQKKITCLYLYLYLYLHNPQNKEYMFLQYH